MSSFCSAKATHIFSAKNFRKLYIESAKIVNEMAFNELVKLTTLWTTGPWHYLCLLMSVFIISFKINIIVWHCQRRMHVQCWKVLCQNEKKKKKKKKKKKNTSAGMVPGNRSRCQPPDKRSLNRTVTFCEWIRHIQCLDVQSNFNGSSIFGTMAFCSRHGLFEPLRFNHSDRSGGEWRYLGMFFPVIYKIMVC